MTLEEARKVAAVCETADGGCSQCVGGITNELNEKFHEFIWTHVGRSNDDSNRIVVVERSPYDLR